MVHHYSTNVRLLVHDFGLLSAVVNVFVWSRMFWKKTVVSEIIRKVSVFSNSAVFSIQFFFGRSQIFVLADLSANKCLRKKHHTKRKFCEWWKQLRKRRWKNALFATFLCKQKTATTRKRSYLDHHLSLSKKVKNRNTQKQRIILMLWFEMRRECTFVPFLVSPPTFLWWFFWTDGSTSYFVFSSQNERRWKCFFAKMSKRKTRKNCQSRRRFSDSGGVREPQAHCFAFEILPQSSHLPTKTVTPLLQTSERF